MKIASIDSFNKNYAKLHKNAGFSGNNAPVNKKNTPEKPVKDPENPINKTMEQLTLLKGVVIAGFGVGARTIFDIIDDNPDAIETALNAGEKIANKKYKNLKNSSAKTALGFASAGAIIIGAVSIIAGLYALCNAPKAIYQGKINAHKKSEDMDVYLKANRVEKDLYNQVGQKAKEASTKKEQDHVKQQYMLLQAAKNQIPEFAKI